MPIQDRAAQFLPFAALSGYDDTIAETARQTSQRICLSEGQQQILDEKLAILQEALARTGKNDAKPMAEITCFIPDERKDGGSYQTISACIKRIEPAERLLFLTDGTAISLDDIADMDSSLFRGLEG